jgi:cobalt-zinc-cadmium efflux system membrane fusion protein
MASAAGALVLPLDSQFLLDLRTAVVRSGPFAPSLRASGTTVAPPDGAVDLAAPTSGAVSYPRALRPGDVVAAGDALAVVTEALGAADRVAGAEARAAAGARLAEARRALALAERDAAKAAGLKDVISDREDLARAEGVVAAREQLRVAEAAWAAIPGATSTLRAPFAGRVSSICARAGETVSAAAPVVRITGEGGLWVNAAVPERWAGQLRTGAEVRLVSDAGGVPVDARVLDPGLEADPATGMLHVVVALDAPVPGLVPGMSVTATIGVGDPREALVVPDSAVVDSDGQTLVFIKTAPERFVLRPVRVGARSGDLREVLAGIEPGERVVVQSTYALRSLAGR